MTDFEVKYYHADDMWPEITIACHGKSTLSMEWQNDGGDHVYLF